MLENTFFAEHLQTAAFKSVVTEETNIAYTRDLEWRIPRNLSLHLLWRYDTIR